MTEPIALIAGLGNPGERYRETRHNAGFWLVEAVAEHYDGRFSRERRFHGALARVEIAGRRCLLLTPETFMNHSGRAVAAACRYYRIPASQLLVAHDDIDLPPGTVRLKRGGGHGGNNGLRDVIQALGEAGFWRLRLGVGHPGSKDAVVDYVLHAPGAEERARIRAAIEAALEVLPLVVSGAQERAMQRLHSGRFGGHSTGDGTTGPAGGEASEN